MAAPAAEEAGAEEAAGAAPVEEEAEAPVWEGVGEAAGEEVLAEEQAPQPPGSEWVWGLE